MLGRNVNLTIGNRNEQETISNFNFDEEIEIDETENFFLL